MEYRPVMPEIVGMWFKFDFNDIADQLTHLLRTRTQSILRDFDCRLRDIQYGEVLVSAKKKVVPSLGAVDFVKFLIDFNEHGRIVESTKSSLRRLQPVRELGLPFRRQRRQRRPEEHSFRTPSRNMHS